MKYEKPKIYKTVGDVLADQTAKQDDGYIYCPITWSGGTCEECMEIFERRMERDD